MVYQIVRKHDVRLPQCRKHGFETKYMQNINFLSTFLILIFNVFSHFRGILTMANRRAVALYMRAMLALASGRGGL